MFSMEDEHRYAKYASARSHVGVKGFRIRVSGLGIWMLVISWTAQN